MSAAGAQGAELTINYGDEYWVDFNARLAWTRRLQAREREVRAECASESAALRAELAELRAVLDRQLAHAGVAEAAGGSTVPQMSPPTQQPSPPAGQPQPKRKRGVAGAGLMVWLSPRRKRDKRAKRVDYKQLAAPVRAREPDVNT